MKRFTTTVVMLLIMIIINLNSQPPPCYPNNIGLSFEYPFLENPFQLYDTLPKDILNSYRVIDSLYQKFSYSQLEDYLTRQTYNDTIKTILKHFYNILDYDPILYLSYEVTGFPALHKSTSRELNGEMSRILPRISPKSFTDLTLLRSGIIAHVLVTDTLTRTDTSDKWAKTSAIVTCQIIDAIKGKVIPICKNTSLNISNENKTIALTQHAIPGACFQFEYYLEWIRGNGRIESTDNISIAVGENNTLLDSNGVPCIEKDHEYIVFLNADFTCIDINNGKFYYSLRPTGYYSNTWTMYPVINGKVYNPLNELGIGNNLTVERFKDELRYEISIIRDYKNK
jgi:hypothetical protein